MTKKVKLKVNKTIYILTLDDLLYCKSNGNNIIIYKTNGTIEQIATSLNKLEEKLSPHLFWRTNNTHLVNLNYLAEVSACGKQEIILVNKRKIPITPNRKENLIEALSHLH